MGKQQIEPHRFTPYPPIIESCSPRSSQLASEVLEKERRRGASRIVRPSHALCRDSGSWGILLQIQEMHSWGLE